MPNAQSGLVGGCSKAYRFARAPDNFLHALEMATLMLDLQPVAR
jgi:hypothetical protein